MPATTTLTPAARDAIILQSVHEATGMLRRFARIYHLELEDLQQDAALIALETVDKAVLFENPRAYIHRAIRNQMYTRLHAYFAMSVTTLDTLYFADTLAEPVPVNHSGRREHITRAIHEALHTLPTIEQELLASTYGLGCEFSVKPGIPLNKRAKLDARDKVRRHQSIKKLRRNKQLQAIFAEGRAVSC